MDKQVRMFAGKVKSVNEKDFTVLATVSDETIDRSGEVIQVSAWVNRLENYKKHPILLSSHNYYGLLNQIGMAKELMIGDSFDVEFKYFVGEGNPEADWAFNLAKKGIVAFSVGFYPKAWVDGDRESGVRRTYTDVELLEISQVLVPCNPSALGKSVDSGDEGSNPIIQRMLDAAGTINWAEEKGVVPFKAYDLMPEDAKWDGAGARKRLFALSGEDFNKYAKGFAWFDDDNKGTQAAYKLPHHDVVGEAIQTNWKGVASAMAALLGARGGTDIPEADRKKVYNHLSKHYAEFKKDAPEFKTYISDEDILTGNKDMLTGIYLIAQKEHPEIYVLTTEDRESIVKEVKTLIQGELGHQGQKQEENHIALILQGVKDISQTLA